MINICADGTVKYKNPFTATECWYTPGRRHRPGLHEHHEARPIEVREPQDYCSFCPANYFQTTPEKGRMVCLEGRWLFEENLTAEEIFSRAADLRRIGNLFEIISLEYWRQNYGHQLSPGARRRKEIYLSTDVGREHVAAMLRHKGHRRGDDLGQAADVFFGGAHDLIIAKRHYCESAGTDAQLFSAGEMTPEEHEQYYRLSLHTVDEFYRENAFIRFVAVYTNWRRDAGATFAHLHRQIIGLDRWGETIQRCHHLAERTPGCFAEHGDLLVKRLGLALCENDYAVAAVDIGQPFSTVAVFSRGAKPLDGYEAAEIRGMSDLVQGIHAALGAKEPCNEEWYYAPRDGHAVFPWFVLIKWRKNRHAGFEGITRLYIDVYRPEEVRDLLRERLRGLRSEGKIAAMRVGEECKGF